MPKRTRVFRFRIRHLILSFILIFTSLDCLASTDGLAAVLDAMAKGDLYNGGRACRRL